MKLVKANYRRGILAALFAVALLCLGWKLEARVAQLCLNAALIQAVKANDEAGVSHLLRRGADSNATEADAAQQEGPGDLLRRWRKRTPSPRPFTALRLAARNSPAIAAILVQHHADVNARDREGGTPLMYAPFLDTGDGRLTRLLLARGADIYACDAHGNVALDYALLAKKPRIARLLLEQGKDIGVHDGEARIRIAAEAVDLDTTDMFKRLLAAWPELYAPENKRNAWLLTGTAFRGDARWLRLLLDYGMDVNTKDKNGATPLISAVNSFCSVGRRNESSIHLLLARGADINAQDNSGETALEMAVFDEDLPVARLLRGLGARAHNSR